MPRGGNTRRSSTSGSTATTSSSQRSDFTINSAVLALAENEIQTVSNLYVTAIERIQEATETLLDTDLWKGNAREEFKATYRILEHYLKEDKKNIASISEYISGIKEIYDTLDVEQAKKIYETLQKAAQDVKE